MDTLSLSAKIVKVIPQDIKLNWMEPYKNERTASSKASGFFIDNQGHILTCSHVVINAKMVLIEIPSLGRDKFPVDILGVCPDLDLAVLKIKPNQVYQSWGGSLTANSVDYRGYTCYHQTGGNLLPSETIKSALPPFEWVELGDSWQVSQGDKVLAVGFPMGQDNIKRTEGTINGRWKGLFQIDAAINPGNSGGPLFKGNKVIGVNNSGIMGSNQIGYAVPIANFFLIKDELINGGKRNLVRRPFFGFDYHTTNPSLLKLRNTDSNGQCTSGIAIKRIYKGSPISKTGIETGDILCSINGIKLDNYGLLDKKWFDEKMNLGDLMKTLPNNANISISYLSSHENLLKHENFQFFPFNLAVHEKFPMYEEIDYVVFAGFVVMNLTLNHIKFLANEGVLLGKSQKLIKYMEPKYRERPVLIVTYIFPNSYISQLGTSDNALLNVGDEIKKVNGYKVNTVAEYREAMGQPVNKNEEYYLHLETDEQANIVLSFTEAIKAEKELAEVFKYQPLNLKQ